MATVIEPFAPERRDSAVAVLADAFVTNPHCSWRPSARDDHGALHRTLDREAPAGYLETDKPENVEFYRTFGFVIQHEESLIGTPTWYMWRPR